MPLPTSWLICQGHSWPSETYFVVCIRFSQESKNSILYHIWSCCDHDFWSWSFTHIFSCGHLDFWTFKLLEMIDTALISVFNWQKLLPGIFKGSHGCKTVFSHVFGHVVMWPSTFKFLEMPNTAQISLSDWQNFLPTALLWSYGSKTVFLSRCGIVVILTFAFWKLYFYKCLTLPQ